MSKIYMLNNVYVFYLFTNLKLKQMVFNLHVRDLETGLPNQKVLVIQYGVFEFCIRYSIDSKTLLVSDTHEQISTTLTPNSIFFAKSKVYRNKTVSELTVLFSNKIQNVLMQYVQTANDRESYQKSLTLLMYAINDKQDLAQQ